MGLAIVVLAAGKGTRMRSELPKVLHDLCGWSMLRWCVENARALRPERIVLVLGHGREAVEGEVAKWPHRELPEPRCVTQEPQLGTGHAVQVTREALEGFAGDVLVLYGDTPLLRADTLRALVAERPAGGLSMLTARPADPTGLGRILRDAEGRVTGIVEERDATDEQRAIREINSGMYAFAHDQLFPYLERLENHNRQGEYYLTDVVGMAVAEGRPVLTHTCDPLETLGVNSLAELARARRVLQDRILEEHLARGVRILDPASAWIDVEVEIGRDTIVHPSCVIERGVRIGAGCTIGPFAHLRPRSVLEDHVEVGNFVEVNRSTLREGSKAKHLTYLGDATVGNGANIGAGTVTANYDGKAKHLTEIGAGAFIGSGAILVAPCKVGDRAVVGANAALVRGEVPEGGVVVGVPAKPIERRRAARRSSPSEET